MKKKILYLITKFDVGGAQKYVADLASNLDKNKFETKILYGGKDIRWLSNKIWPFLLNDWLAIWEIVKLLKKERPVLIHLNSSKAGVLGAIAATIYKRIAKSEKRKAENNKNEFQNKNLSAPRSSLIPKIVFTAHGWIFNPTNTVSWPIRWFYIFLHKIAAVFQDKIICVSEYDHNLALSYRIAPPKKLVTIHNGIDPNIKFLDKETARKELAKKLTPYTLYLTPNHPWIGSIGRLVPAKNYETFIQAAALIPNAYFFIIGEGPEYKRYKSLVISYKLENRFFIIDPTGNDFQYLKAFDIFVMSSIKEGLPYILLEAMAAELPIVVTEAGGMPEVIKNHENGLMVSQKNPEFMARAIQGLLANPNIAKELGKMSKQAVTEKFNLEKMVLETAEIYSNL